jgi:hypothetical protein
MSRLRRSIMTQIHSALENSLFTAWDFVIEFPDRGEDLARIKFISDPQYIYIIQEAPQQQALYRSVQIPGSAKTQEITGATNIETCISGITGWCRRIREEISVNALKPIYDEFEFFKKEIDEKLNQHKDELNELFNDDEIEDMSEKLEHLKEQLILLQEKQSIADSELSKIKNDIDSMKENIKSFPKNVWYRTTSNKILSLFIRIAGSKEGRELAVHAAKALLPGEEGTLKNS